MNRPPRIHSHVLHWLARLAPLLLACNLHAFGAGPATNAPKTHTLFMGADLALASKDKSLPVLDVQNSSYIVQDAGNRLIVSPRDEQFKLKIVDNLKLAATYATVEKITFDRAYSLGNDPMQKFADSARASAYMAGGITSTDVGVMWADMSLGLAQGALGALPADSDPRALIPFKMEVGNAEARLAMAETESRMAQSLSQIQAFNPVGNSVNMTTDLAAEEFDALNVSFELSVPRPLDKPYLVIIMRYFKDKGRSDSANVWVYAQSLPILDNHPRKFYIRRTGFPPGYQIDSYQLHIYDAGREVATTASRKQVALTTDEAFEYAVIEYIGDNREKTKAPLKAKGFWPSDLLSRLVPAKLTRTLYVKVGKDGHALGLFEDEDCAKPVADTEIAALVPELCFLPALQKGKPVTSIAQIKLGNLN